MSISVTGGQIWFLLFDFKDLVDEVDILDRVDLVDKKIKREENDYKRFVIL